MALMSAFINKPWKRLLLENAVLIKSKQTVVKLGWIDDG